jgi:hypothetical protein
MTSRQGRCTLQRTPMTSRMRRERRCRAARRQAARAATQGGEAADAARVDDVVDPLKQRVDELHRLLDPYAQNHRTTAIVRGERNGQQIDIVASSISIPDNGQPCNQERLKRLDLDMPK